MSTNRLEVPAEALAAGRQAAARTSELYLSGDLASARQAAVLALPHLEPAELASERRETLRLLALAGSEQGAFDQALEAAQRLVRESAEAEDDGVSLMAAYALAVCLERMGDPWQAQRVLDEALLRHEPGASRRERLIGLNALAALAIGIAHRVRDVTDPADREQALALARSAGERARRLLGDGGEPAYEVAVLGNLGEVLVLQGEADPGGQLLGQALEIGLRHGLTAHVWRMSASQGERLLLAGRPRDALDAMESLLAAMGSRAPAATATRARDVAHRAARALGLFEQALVHLESLEQLERRRSVQQLRAQSQLLVTRGEVQRAQWQAEQARQDARRQRERAADLAFRALHDPLTGLGNRAQLEQRGAELVLEAREGDRPLALALLDLDHFKQVNDRFGHGAGDAVLIAMAQMLRDATRGADLLVRLGGEEFVVLLPGAGPREALEVCERLRRTVAQRDQWPELPEGQRITLSGGLCTRSGPLSDRLRNADIALYQAKREGRNRICVAID